jgi:hypothetical protein
MFKPRVECCFESWLRYQSWWKLDQRDTTHHFLELSKPKSTRLNFFLPKRLHSARLGDVLRRIDIGWYSASASELLVFLNRETNWLLDIYLYIGPQEKAKEPTDCKC